MAVKAKFHIFPCYQNRSMWRIAWDDDDGEPGRYLGSEDHDPNNPYMYPFTSQQKANDPNDPVAERILWEIWTADRTCASHAVERDSFGFMWESEGAAKKALREVKIALQQDRQLPTWAKIAIAEGWKPPKGWKA